MRKTRVRAIREQEIQSPEGMSSATFRAAKRRHSRGYNRVQQPKPLQPTGMTGFPKNTVQVIRTWYEKRNRIISSQFKKPRRKMVTRIISLKMKKDVA